MTQFLLPLGSALIAFAPSVALFCTIAYEKAQLVIVLTTAAFFFLLASVGSGLSWVIFDAVGLSGPLAAIIPAVFFQFIARCNFVAVYHVVERVIQTSLENQSEQTRRERLAAATNGTQRGTDENAIDDPDNTQDSERRREDEWAETARLRLALNDASCGVAAGIGFGAMHAVMLFGTLLAGQIDNNVGVVYQDSCPSMPSLVVSALFAGAFTILDVFWMLFTFFGMRRRSMYSRGERLPSESHAIGGWLGNSRTGGNVALLIVLGTHMMTSFFTVADYLKYGCAFSLSMVGLMVLFTAYLFWAGVGRIYMPPKRRQNRSDHVYRSMNPPASDRGNADPNDRQSQVTTDFERHED